MTDLVKRLRGDIPHRVIESHWTVDFDALDAEREEAANEIERLHEELKWAKTEAEQARVMADALQTKLDELRKDYDELYEKWCDRDQWY